MTTTTTTTTTTMIMMVKGGGDGGGSGDLGDDHDGSDDANGDDNNDVDRNDCVVDDDHASDGDNARMLLSSWLPYQKALLQINSNRTFERSHLLRSGDLEQKGSSDFTDICDLALFCFVYANRYWRCWWRWSLRLRVGAKRRWSRPVASAGAELHS